MTKTVLITGGSRGIGYATAELFAMRGWNVTLCSRKESEAKQAAERILRHCEEARRADEAIQKAKGWIAAAAAQPRDDVAVIGLAADIGNADDIAVMFKHIDRRFPALDALVNNAAVLHLGNVFDLSESAFEDMMRVNVNGMMRCCKHAFTRMKESGGSIVNISSIAGIQGVDKFPSFWGYTASKFAVVGLTEGLAVEGKPLGIRVNCIAPGATDTEMLHKAAPGLKPGAIPEDIAKIAYYLCDKEESGILSGTTIPVFSNS